MRETPPRPAGGVRLWLRAIRPFAFTASVMPVVIGAMLALGSGEDVLWGLLPLVTVATVLFHTGTNLISDVADYRRGVDRAGAHGGGGVLLEGLLTSKQLFLGGLAAFAFGSAIGLIIVYVRGIEILWFGLAGLVGGFFYGGGKFGYKYIALGDPMVFVLMGPLIVVGTAFSLTGHFDIVPVLVSLPVGCLVTAILHANNTRDIANDRQAGARTVANTIGLKAAKIEYVSLVGGAYAIVIGLVAASLISLWGLLVVLSLPIALGNILRILRAKPGDSSPMVDADLRSAQLHLLFCLLLSVGLLISALT